MEQTALEEELDRVEGIMLQGQFEPAQELLAHLAEDAEEYVDKNCQTTEQVQWFSFPTLFERLAYRRVENDPRELHDVGEPFDRLYNDLGYVQARLDNYDAAIESLKRAVRWNPMDCASRLNLADLFQEVGNTQEYLALTYSVFERASDARHLVRAFLNFAGWFEKSNKPQAAAAALHAARALDTTDPALDAALQQAKGTPQDPDVVSDKEAEDLLGAEGLPDGANAEIAICLLMCASDAAQADSRDLAAHLTVRARDLVGAPAAQALLELIRETDDDTDEDSAQKVPRDEKH